ncbi:MAG: PAS domain S-box protein, partial [Cyanobacteria bacterium SZAS LIN-2]|nr:PAS domain S-box protein [Cyanobacteria bacterium SZAS LIN-2]
KISRKIDLLAHKASTAINKVEELASENPEEASLYTKIVGLLRGVATDIASVNAHYAQGDKMQAAKEWMLMQAHIDEIMVLTDDLFLQQKKLQGERELAMETNEKAITLALYASVILSCLTALGLALFFNRSTSDRLQIIMDNTNRIGAGKPPLGLLSGDDELTRIDRLYHQMYEDLASLREKERALLDNAAELICSIDSNLRISDINLSAQKILRIDPQELIGHRVLDLIAAPEQERIGTRLEKAFEADNDSERRFDAKMKCADGTIIDTEWATTASAGGDSLYCVILDVTQRKLIEQMRRDFVAMISHDLRTPLSSIQMILSMTREEAEARKGLSSEGLEGLTIAQNSASRLLALVNNLLDLEKLESGQFELLARQDNLYRPLREAVGSVEPLARQKKIILNLEVNQDLEAYFDEERIIQVVINLVSNALKFSPRNSTVTVSAKRNGDSVQVAISDQGRGIPEAMRVQIFERFRQVMPEDQYQMKGAGLGLAICKAIVERHRGEIGVQSTEGKGSSFWFTLPVSSNVFMRLEQEAKTTAIG